MHWASLYASVNKKSVRIGEIEEESAQAFGFSMLYRRYGASKTKCHYDHRNLTAVLPKHVRIPTSKGEYTLLGTKRPFLKVVMLRITKRGGYSASDDHCRVIMRDEKKPKAKKARRRGEYLCCSQDEWLKIPQVHECHGAPLLSLWRLFVFPCLLARSPRSLHAPRGLSKSSVLRAMQLFVQRQLLFKYHGELRP